MMKISIVGGGFVGRATAKGLRAQGHSVLVLDVDPRRIRALWAEGLDAHDPHEYRSLTGEVTMISVPTPTVDGRIQLDHLVKAAMQFGERLRSFRGYHVLVVRSTVPPRTTRDVVIPIVEEFSGKTAGRDFGVAMQPEYLREVTAVQDFARPWLITIGALDARSGDVVHRVYRGFDAPIERVTLEDAEFQKYVHNLYNAVKIAFFNEMRIMANGEGWDSTKIFQMTAETSEGVWNPVYGIRDRGPFGGSCLPKDTAALLQWGEEHGYQLGILKAVIAENDRHGKLLNPHQQPRSGPTEMSHA
jgi:UDPglucose 6-dehydrogenase